jgi:tartrate dehydratase beta subunit/fumarate hydratase class I family protein
MNHKIFQQIKSHDGVQFPTFGPEMINHISVSNDSLSHVVFIDEVWHILMQQRSMLETAQR